MKGKHSRTLVLASAVAGLLAGTALPGTAHADRAQADKVKCYGINKCKGMGACGGKGHSCAGKNACKGQGYLELDRETCLKIEGGRLTPEPPKN
ncbi:MAG: hypothetical protein KatS3mg076_0897 [Candidatus Binatia bacterium]|nr:MAG: hypothetical protein KatS3mg076_0897 [Candidatus Binatia bacterium]